MDNELSGVAEYICSLSWVKFTHSSLQKRIGVTNLIEEWDCISRVGGGCDHLGKVFLKNTRNDLGEAEAFVIHQIVQYLRRSWIKMAILG